MGMFKVITKIAVTGFIISIIFSCTVAPKYPAKIEKPEFVAQNYTLDEIKKEYPEYGFVLDKAIELYEKFALSGKNQFVNIEELFVENNQGDGEKLQQIAANAHSGYFGLERIEIDSSYFDFPNSLKKNYPYYKILNYTIPMFDLENVVYVPKGPVENYLILNCLYYTAFKTRSELNVSCYRLYLQTQLNGENFLISKMDIVDERGDDLKVPFLLKPFMWFRE